MSWQPKLNADQQLQLMYHGAKNDVQWDNALMGKFVFDEWGIELKSSTMSDWKQRLYERYEDSADADKLVDWTAFSEMERQHVPIHLLRTLRRIDDELTKAKRAGMQGVPNAPTYRRLRYWAVIVEYYGDIITDLFDVCTIADSYAYRAMYADYNNEILDTSDIDDWLRFKPWSSDEALQEYKDAIDSGSIKALDHQSTWWNILKVMKEPEQQRAIGTAPMLYTFLENSPNPYALPSQVDFEAIANDIAENLKPRIVDEDRPRYIKDDSGTWHEVGEGDAYTQ